MLRLDARFEETYYSVVQYVVWCRTLDLPTPGTSE
jgi:hypothetical protein